MNRALKIRMNKMLTYKLKRMQMRTPMATARATWLYLSSWEAASCVQVNWTKSVD